MKQQGQGRQRAGYVLLLLYERGSPIWFLCLLLYFGGSDFERTRRTSCKSSVQNKTFQLCSKCHHKPPSVNIKLPPLEKKISLPGLWHKIELLNGWLSRLQLGRFMDPVALQSLRLDLAYRCYSRCMRTACAQPLACHQHLDHSRTRQWKACTSLPPGREGYKQTSSRQEESMPSSFLLWILVIKLVISQTK